MTEDFFETPKKMLREYAQHLVLIALDVLFMLTWVVFMGLYHLASEWIIHRLGLGPVDQAVKWGFDITFAAITFFWVVKSVWKVHRDAHARPRPRRKKDENQPG